MTESQTPLKTKIKYNHIKIIYIKLSEYKYGKNKILHGRMPLWQARGRSLLGPSCYVTCWRTAA